MTSLELVRTHTTDGHRLDGALTVPTNANQLDASTPQAWLLLHGVGGNFYAGSLLERLAAHFNAAGAAVVRVNTRGHDSVSICWGSLGPVRQGAAHEIVDHCRHDISAWLQFLRERGYRRLGILGHSLGAIKAIYSQAFESSDDVQAVVAVSPPRLSYSAFMASESQPAFFAAVAEARQLIEQRQPESLFTARFPFPILITAAGYLDKYGPEEKYNILNFCDRVPCPLLITYGQVELEQSGIAFAGMPESLQSKRRADQSLSVSIVPQADHNYTSRHAELTAAIDLWQRSTSSNG